MRQEDRTLKKADPATKSALKSSSKATQDSGNNTRVHLSPTERRIVKLLLDKPHISYEVESLAFCRYAADNIQHIRAKGICVTTTMVDYTRLDGKSVKVGEYSIPPESRELAARSAYAGEGNNASKL